VTRNELKELVKECLLEIIIEGSPKTVVESVRERNSKPTTKERAAPRRPALDHIRPNGRPAPSPVPQPRPNPSNYKDLVGGNDVMASIFADTAASGLVESLGSSGQQRSNPIVDTGVDPTILDGASNWSALAFAETTRTRSR